VEGRFYWGFSDFHRVFAWFFVVTTWWLSAKTWFFDGLFFAAKNLHGFEIYFFGSDEKADSGAEAPL
jgi:hypothetical protein